MIVTVGVIVGVILTVGVTVGVGDDEGYIGVGLGLLGLQHKSRLANESSTIICISSLIGKISVPLSLVILYSPIKLPVFFVSLLVNCVSKK